MTLPDPLVPPGVDLRDFGYMPLDALRLRDSELAIEASPEVFRASVLLWCASWHQVPAGSLPMKDKTLAEYSRSGARWPRIRAEVLSKWIECDDGRLYHPVVAEKAREAQAAKDSQRARTKAATEAREAKRRAQPTTRDEQRHVARDDERDVQRDVVQGKGREGKGRQETSEAGASGGSAPPDPADVIFGLGIPLLTAASVAEKNARSMLGMFRKQHGDAAVIEALQRCADEKPMQPVPWLQAVLKAKPPQAQQAETSFTRDRKAQADVWMGTAGPRAGSEVIDMEDLHARRKLG